jgi:phosphate starvation-inducible protein PhoH
MADPPLLKVGRAMVLSGKNIKGGRLPFLSSGNSSVTIVLGGETETLNILGAEDRNLKRIRKSLKARFSVRDNVLTVLGDSAEAKRAFPVFSELSRLNRRHGSVTGEMIEQALEAKQLKGLAAPGEGAVSFSALGKFILPRTLGQKLSLVALRRHALVRRIVKASQDQEKQE